jgi:hypothetical protein
LDNVVIVRSAPVGRFNHFLGTLEPNLAGGGYRGTIWGVEFELHEGRNAAGEHILAVAVVTDGNDRPGAILMEAGR